MNVDPSMCASSGNEVPWDQLDWPRHERHVRRLQARIVKATQEGRWGKVKTLQWLLTHSFSGKALAVKRVTENQGKRTPGVDRIVWKTPKAKLKAIESLERRGYPTKHHQMGRGVALPLSLSRKAAKWSVRPMRRRRRATRAKRRR
jgi:RNA-directed DNA polymerase